MDIISNKYRHAWIFLLVGILSSSSFAEELPQSLASSLTSKEISLPEYVIVRASDEATFSSETAAAVSKLPLKEGSTFAAGDVLLELDCRVQTAELKKAKAQQLAAAIAEKSAEKLKRFDAISQYELVKAISEGQIANAEVDKLNAVVEKCIIKAPFNGAISELKVHAHESVKPGDPLMKIVNTENPNLEMQLPSSWLSWLHVGSPFTVHINELNKDINAKITKINPEIEPVSQTIKVTGSIIHTDPHLLPGMSGQATFVDNPANQKKKTH